MRVPQVSPLRPGSPDDWWPTFYITTILKTTPLRLPLIHALAVNSVFLIFLLFLPPTLLPFFPLLAAVAHLEPSCVKHIPNPLQGAPQALSIPQTKYFRYLADSKAQKARRSWRSETIQPAIIKLEINEKRVADAALFRYGAN